MSGSHEWELRGRNIFIQYSRKINVQKHVKIKAVQETIMHLIKMADEVRTEAEGEGYLGRERGVQIIECLVKESLMVFKQEKFDFFPTTFCGKNPLVC